MHELLELLSVLVFFVIPLWAGLMVGSWAERRHIRRLDERESQNGDFLITQLKTLPEADPSGPQPMLLLGEAVVASDYFKSFVGGLRKIVGGEMRSYHSLVTRSRREALQRVIDQARAAGYNAVCNVRYESSDIGGATTRKKGAVMATTLVSATAYRR